MRAVTLDAFDAPPALREDLPEPTPAPTEVLVRGFDGILDLVSFTDDSAALLKDGGRTHARGKLAIRIR